MQVCKCDRCGKIFDSSKISIYKTAAAGKYTVATNNRLLYRFYDLCAECGKSLEEWMERGPAEAVLGGPS